MALPPFGRWFLRDVLKPETREASALSRSKKCKIRNRGALLSRPLGRAVGWQGRMAGWCRFSVNKAKARELSAQIEQIAEASGLADNSSFGGPLGRGRFRLQRGRWKSWPGTAVWAGIRPHLISP